ncbi:hypothetical protein C8J57DRAFT_1534950 [Mycena rebaudengoi]|nr:hypothetical protein C8J57DRAFT_1534950 [Mycena rebaudengoi]
MSKVESSGSEAAPNPSLLVLTDGNKRVLITRPKTYAAAVDMVHQHFPRSPRPLVRLQTDQLDICNGEHTDITSSIWETAMQSVSSVFVLLETSRHICCWDPSNTGEKIQLFVRFSRPLTVTVKTDTVFELPFHLIAQHFGLEYDSLRYQALGKNLSSNMTPAYYGLHNDQTISACLRLKGGKPVIYLYISALYPVVPTKTLPSGNGEQINWTVHTRADGTLRENTTGLDVSYLYWEALPRTRFDGLFSPITCDLSPANSVLLPVNEITLYLDKALLALGLHTEARTSFITYWLPSFLKHNHVALRFVPQAAYEVAARLDIVPAPDVVTRVFMLFKGISEERRGEWDLGAHSQHDHALKWRAVVGVDVERALDASLFRVLEWGGMEVVGR